MPSAIDETLRRHRRRLIERERAAFRAMLAEYRRLQRELRVSLTEAARIIADARRDGKVISPAWISRQQRLTALLDQVNREVLRYGGRVADIVTAEQAAMLPIAAEQTRELLTLVTRAGVPGSQLTPRAVETAVGMLGDGSPLWSYFEKTFAPAVARRLRDEIVSAAAFGTDFRTIARRLTEAGDITRYRALAMARTEVNRVRRAATLEQYRESGVVSGWEWVAAKSERTCPACLAMDGRIFSLDDEFPQHINCRCTMIPVIEGVERRPRTLGRDWFEEQPDEVKERMLGKQAFESYKRGEFTLDDVVGWATSKEFGKRIYTKKLADILMSSGKT